MKNKTGLNAATIAFILADGGQCRFTREVNNNINDLNAFRNGGGKVKASFGGFAGTYLENACTTDTALASQVVAFIDQTGITDLDFDVEQAIAESDAVNDRRARALKRVQDQRPGTKISFTLPSRPKDKFNTPGGLPDNSVKVVRAALNAGVKISYVNLMTMDFGPFFSDGQQMGPLSITAIEGARTQLQGLIPGLSNQQAFAMLGITPMIGVNDVQSEVFRIADANAVVAFARANKLGLVSFWGINRDQPCGSDNSLVVCSRVNTARFQFNSAFAQVLRP
jgi:chitinase